mgnify:CR=1 FL=1
MDLIYIGAWLAIWLSGLGVALGQWMLAKTSIEILGKNPKLASQLRIFTILWIALVESAAIYWFVVAYQILTVEDIASYTAIWAGLAIWIPAFWAWYWEWKLVSGAMIALNRNPENKNTVLQFMILFLALIEVVAIYGLIIAQKLIK